MKNTVLFVLMINIIAAPCLLIFNEPNALTGEWSWWLNIIGIVYAFFLQRFVKKIIKFK